MTTIPANHPASAVYPNQEDFVPVIRGRISWGPIMMGAICAIGLQFIFTVLGIALGASAGEGATGVDGTSVRTVGMVAGLWWLITGTIALAVGGFVFGRLSGLPRSMPLKLEAAAMWAVVALFGFMVVWSGAGMLSQAASPIGAVSAASLDPYSMRTNRDGTAGNGSMLSPTNQPVNAVATDGTWAEDARRATRAASWWSVIGLVVGLGASLGGACMGAPGPMRNTASSL